jgi:hypothetical protein
LLGGHLFLYEKIATSSTLSNPLAASPELFPVPQSATDVAKSLNHRLARIQKRRSASLKRGRGCGQHNQLLPQTKVFRD